MISYLLFVYASIMFQMNVNNVTVDNNNLNETVEFLTNLDSVDDKHFPTVEQQMLKPSSTYNGDWKQFEQLQNVDVGYSLFSK